MRHTAPIPLRALLFLTGAVALAHVWVLQAATVELGATPGKGQRVFTTRTLEISAEAAPVPQPGTAAPTVASRPKARNLPAPTLSLPNQATPAPEVAVAAPAEPPEPAVVAATTPQASTPEPAASAAAAAVETTAPATAAAAAPPPLAKDAALVARNYQVPGSVRIKFNATGRRGQLEYKALGELLWLHDGLTYDARLELSAWPIMTRAITSSGRMTADGLSPARFADRFRSERAAHFERDMGRITFSANTPDAALLPGAQDQLSVFMQLAAMIAGEPDKYPAGTSINMQTIGPRSAEPWVFVVDTDETLYLPGGQQQTRKLVRTPRKDFDQKVEVWLAPALAYLPARIRITQPNGDFIDQQWRSTSTP